MLKKALEIVNPQNKQIKKAVVTGLFSVVRLSPSASSMIDPRQAVQPPMTMLAIVITVGTRSSETTSVQPLASKSCDAFDPGRQMSGKVPLGESTTEH